ncbi:MAG: hypothetical protein ACI9MC_003522 [Kiritimatiellia bacterium]
MRALFVATLLTACAGQSRQPGDPLLWCPGDPSGVCDTVRKPEPLQAGAAQVSIVPECFETWTDADGNAEYSRSKDTFFDCGCDRLCPDDPDYTGPDEGEGDETFQAIWIAGFQQSRAALGVRPPDVGLIDSDGLYLQALVLKQDDTSMALITVDAFGIMNGDVLAIRQAVAAAGLDIDHVIVNSSHSHATPDSLGIYGPTLTKSGYDARYFAQVRQAAVQAVQAASAELQPVVLTTSRVDLPAVHPDKGITNFITDTRDPWIIDRWLNVMHVADGSGDTVATLVHWGNHPEAAGSGHAYLSADFVAGVRHAVGKGWSWESRSVQGVGGVTMYVQGMVGGMMTPLRIEHVDWDGTRRRTSSFAKADALGLQLGALVVDSLADGTVADAPQLAFRQQTMELPIDNFAFQAMFLLGTLSRETHGWNNDLAMTDDNRPFVMSEVGTLQIGPVHMLTLPGEVLPELVIGGYDGSQVHFDGRGVVTDDNPNPPPLDDAPAGPYLQDRMQGEHRWVLGLTNDQVGYIVPTYNFQIDERAPYIDDAPGDHYEETNSLGPNTAQRVEATAIQILEWRPR